MCIKNKKAFYYCCIMLIAGIAFSLHPMISSTYSSIENGLFFYFAAAVPFIVTLVAATKYVDKPLPIFAILLALVLTLGNASAMPLLRYTSAYEIDNVVNYSKEICVNSLLSFITASVVFVMLTIERWLHEAIIKFSKLILIGYSAVSLIISAATLLFVHDASGTTIINIVGFSFQVAIPIMIISIIGIALAWNMDNAVMKVIYISGVVLMNLSLVIRGETGIPLILFVSFCIWYTFIQPFRHKLLSRILVAICILGVGIIVLIHFLYSYLPDNSLFQSLATKIEGRIFTSSVDQVENARYSIGRGGIWGSQGYNIHLSQGSSDFSMATILHYNGFVYLIVILAIAIPFFCSGFRAYTKRKSNIGVSLGGLSHICMFVMMYYNIFMCLGSTPVLGSQIPFTGVSVMYALLSGFLLGAIVYDNEIADQIINKIKEGFNDA